ncbi:MAG: DUF1565 domain-containing protein [Candidatus Coatesbacteria bacterium]|nr:DUF1565 domain-containing protein [Candidatus Coatesbacteria bacterium]
MKRLIVLCCMLVLLFAPCAGFCTDYYVDVNTGSDHNSGSSPDDAWKTITWALAVGIGTQDDQCVIHIAPGKYAPPLEVFPLAPPSYTSLVGASPEEVVIDAEGSACVLGIGGDRVVLSGLTVTGGSASQGGGICVARRGCRIDNCVVRGNQSDRGGGLSIDFPGGGFAEVNDCIICENRAGGDYHCQGGGIYMSSQYGEGLVRVTRCLISSNVSSQGAGIAVVRTSLELVDSVLADNIAESQNEYESVGGGLGVRPIYSLLMLDAKNCLFISNRNLDGPGGAGFINLDVQGTAAKFSGCTFAGNTARDAGPALDVEIHKDYSLDAVEVTDCIFRDGGDEISEERAGLVVVNNSCVEGGWAGAGQNNFDADPLFVSGPFCDYYLSQRAAGQGQDSPCVDAGSMTAAEAGMAAKTTRTDGMADTGVVDIGFHYPMLFMPPQVWVSTPSDTYSHGDTLEMVFEVINPNPFSYPVDLYAAIIAADGVIWTIDAGWNWAVALNPWFASLELPAGLTFGPTTLLTIALPSASPPISAPGTYWAAAAFAHVGTTTFIGQPSLSAFELIGD